MIIEILMAVIILLLLVVVISFIKHVSGAIIRGIVLVLIAATLVVAFFGLDFFRNGVEFEESIVVLEGQEGVLNYKYHNGTFVLEEEEEGFPNKNSNMSEYNGSVAVIWITLRNQTNDSSEKIGRSEMIKIINSNNVSIYPEIWSSRLINKIK